MRTALAIQQAAVDLLSQSVERQGIINKYIFQPH